MGRLTRERVVDLLMNDSGVNSVLCGSSSSVQSKPEVRVNNRASTVIFKKELSSPALIQPSPKQKNVATKRKSKRSIKRKSLSPSVTPIYPTSRKTASVMPLKTGCVTVSLLRVDVSPTATRTKSSQSISAKCDREFNQKPADSRTNSSCTPRATAQRQKGLDKAEVAVKESLRVKLRRLSGGDYKVTRGQSFSRGAASEISQVKQQSGGTVSSRKTKSSGKTKKRKQSR